MTGHYKQKRDSAPEASDLISLPQAQKAAFYAFIR